MLAFETFYREHAGRLCSALTASTGQPELARDAVSEAFGKALARWDRVESLNQPAGWVYKTARNIVRRTHRRRQLEHRLLLQQSPYPEEARLPDLDPQLWAAVRSLPPRQREAIAWRYVADLSEPEVANVMGISEGAASAHLHVARAKLRDALQPEGVGRP